MDNPKSFPVTSWLALTVLACLLSGSAPAQQTKPGLSAGEKAPPFLATTTDGKPVNFPGDYKGKIVLLDFWATWCGPCRHELPGLSAAYDKFHGQGLEVLGVSLDQPANGPKLLQFCKDNHMPWPQIYDGKYWKAELAVKYNIHSIPRPILVDGDTGVILAEGPAVRGERLAPAIEKALAAKGKTKPRAS